MCVCFAPAASSRQASQTSRWCQKRRTLFIEDRMIAFTRTEYKLLLPLHSGEPITYADLASSAYGYLLDLKVRTMMDKHIDRIRGKLRGSGIYIYCILGYGYVLLPEIVEAQKKEHLVLV
jgi:DNA-binding response OmpR family regulator